MLNGPSAEIEIKATRPKLDSMQKVREEVLCLLRNISWEKESDTLGIGNFLFRGPKGSGKKTAAHVVADVLFDFGLIPSRECVITSVQSIASSVRELKAGILVIEVSKRYDWYSELDDAMQWEDLVETSLIIVAGDYSDIDFGSAMETRSEVKKLFRHSFDFDFGSWDERDCVGLFERHAR